MIEYREIPNKHVELRTSASKGEGIFAATPFKTGDTLMVGVIEKTLSKNHSHASQVGKDKYVFHADLISKFNHSCNPNCGIAVNKSGAHDFIAMKDIKAGEEATFDYAMRNYGIDYFPMKCKCGEKECRGQITGWKDLSVNRKSDYAGYVAPYLLEIDAELLREERKKTKTVAVNSSEAAVQLPSAILWSIRTSELNLVDTSGWRKMHNSDFMRGEAVRYHLLASTTRNVALAEEYLELATVCELVAIDIDNLRTSG